MSAACPSPIRECSEIHRPATASGSLDGRAAAAATRLQVTGEDRGEPGEHRRLALEGRLAEAAGERERDGCLASHAGDVAHDEQQPHPGDRGAGDRGVRGGAGEPVEPAQALPGVAAQAEVQPQGQHELGGIGVAPELEEPETGRAEVRVVGLEPVEDRADRDGQQPWVGRDGELAEVLGVRVGRREPERRPPGP